MLCEEKPKYHSRSVNGCLKFSLQLHRLGCILGDLQPVRLEFLCMESFDLLCDLEANTFGSEAHMSDISSRLYK